MILYYYRHKLSKLIPIILAIGFIVVFYSSRLTDSEIISAYSERGVDLYTAGNRMHLWKHAINNIITHPFGWQDSVEYVHNMWLDIARVAGALPFITLVFLTISSFISLWRILRIKNSESSALFLGLYICFFLSLFVEPITGGTHLFLFVMIWGMQESYLYNSKSR
jgi:hypothetical protein